VVNTGGISYDQLQDENERLRIRLEEAEETLHAIREGRVDAFLMQEGPAEQVLILSGAERPYQLLVEKMQQGAVTVTDGGTIAFANPRFRSLVGLADDPVIGAELHDLVCESDRPALARLLAGGKKGGAEGELCFVRRDGATFSALVTVSPLLADSDILCLIVTDLSIQKRQEEERLRFVQDIAERRQTEEVLRHSEEQFRQLANLLPQMVWTAQPSGETDYFNDRWYEFTGMPRGMFGDPGWQPVLHPDDLPRTIETWQKSVATGEHYEIEYRFVDRASGGYRWFLGRAFPVRDDAGKILRWVGSCTDINDAKRAQEALREADQRKDEFLAMLAHELRNPLAPIRSALELLRAGADADASQLAGEIMERQVQHLVRLVDDLFDVSRVMRGRIELRKEQVELAAAMNHAIEEVQPLVREQAHRLHLSFSGEEIWVSADPTRLAQIIGNLVNNAAKYTPSGGHLWLSTALENGIAVVRVRDSGIGIAPHMLPRVFDLFSQADGSLDRSKGGLGIGLAVVRTLVEMHGGAIEAHSEGLGKGSEFVLRLPALARAQRKQNAEWKPAPVKQRRILVVDDNRGAAQILSMLLSKFWGHQVHLAHDGKSAIEMAIELKPEIVLLDIGLPEMNGFEVAQTLRQQPETASALIVALTGYGQDDDRRRSSDAGFDEHLLKPASVATLEPLFTHSRLAK